MPPPGSFMRTAARNDDRPSPPISSPVKLTLATRNLPSKSSLSRDETSASPMSPETVHRPPRTSSRQKLRDHTDISFSGSNGKTSSTGNHAKLHKRGGSASSLPGPPSPFTNAQFQTPFATYEESFPEVVPAPGTSTPKIKPYLRKMSVAKEDQGMIDLSKSAAENERLNGLGIQDYGSKSAADVSFAHTRRGQQQHGRTTSGASQGSNGSGGFRPGQPFTHPMAKTPRPYTPPTGSYANSINENEADESDDVVEDEFRLGNGFRTRRSMSISSTPQPTPLSQSHTASDLGLVPKLTSSSQTNLSLKSAQSSTGRPRRNTDRSQEYVPSPSSRTSFDKAFSFAKRSDPEPQTRDEMIREARRKFEEKEANKDRKQEKEAGKRQDRQRQKSEPSLKSAMKQEKKPRKDSAARAGAEDEKHQRLQAVSYEEQRPAMLPRHGSSPGESERRLNEKGPQFNHTPRPDAKDGGWLRFSTWVQTRMLSCGGSRD
ncbi:hypothetical protein PRZ48_004569 [Zasmidium cellare]|uniref:Uncharacterized protein n=1 Tax=Zasmidium cellare TaxID=395010 RepID=A0ABR0EQJ7_ZASCE|nr:hypothetical protein PRZ48_004569 [Zasmidium cellare]